MKRLFTSCCVFLLLISLKGIAQTDAPPAVNDTATFPYWIQMMQDPSANFFKVQRAFELYWQGRPITKGCGWKVFKRWEYMTQSRVTPDGQRPAPDAVVNAYAKWAKSNKSLAGNWTSMGPSVIPSPGPAGYEGLGRLNAVGFHPTDQNKIYVGSPSGGMWQSADGGATWITHTDSLATLGVSAILVDASNPNKILIGTGDRDAGDAPGLGVYKSLDGGVTWTASKTGMGNQTVGKLIQNPSNAQIILAATSGGVFRSTDGGANWTLSKSGNFKDICFKPGDPTIVYAAWGADFWRSSNSGTSFAQITSGLTSGQRGSIAVTAANPNYVYFLQSDNSSGFKGLYRSTDAGLSFTTRSTTPNIMDWSCDGSGSGGQGWYDLSIAADPTNAETIYAGGVDIWKSTNGGTSWAINAHWYGGCSVPAVHADCHFLGYSPVNGKLYTGVDGGVYWTANGGTSWTDITVGMTIGQIYKLGQAQTVKNQVINGFQDNGTYTIYPSGWEATGGGDGMECAIDYTNASWMYHTIYYGDIFRTFNNNSETQIAGNGVNGITEDGAWVTPFILSKSDPKMMFVGYKNIWRCPNVQLGSPVWTKISNSLGGSNSVNMADLEQSPANNNILYAARSDNKLFRTDNALAGTPTWTDLTANLPASGTATDLAAHPTDQNTVYMTMGTNVYKSIDKGLNWTNITGSLPGVAKNAIVCYKNAPEAIYVGTDAGVYYKDNNTGSWVSFSTNLPLNCLVTELDIFYDNDSVSMDGIRASTYGRGLWGSDMYSAYTADFTADSTSICQGQNVDYTDLSTSGATAWNWVFPGGTPSSSTLQNPQNIVYSTPGTYNVTLTTYYGSFYTSSTKTGYISVAVTPSTPQVPAGDTLLCQNNSNTSYTTLSVPGATTYTWSLNPSSAGSMTPNDTTVVIDWDNSFTGYAVLMVQASGTCGTSPFSPGLSIHLRPFPSIPAIPTGPVALCTGTASSQYTTTSSLNATTYVWRILPSAAGTIAGTDTVGTVTWNQSYTGAAGISVKAVNDCNESLYSDPLNVSVNAIPQVQLGPDTTLCDYQSVLLDAGNPGSAYLWSTGQTTQTILVDSTGIGYSTEPVWAHVTANGCLGGDTILVTFTVCQGIQPENGNWTIAIYPNPNHGKFSVEIRSPRSSEFSLRLMNLLGTQVYSQKGLKISGRTVTGINLAGLPEGIYYLIIESGSNQQVRKVVFTR
jgi:photosystem II stability/assembly factor-like uncharacterized protein